jgi:thiol-disulfide isomerase/thioredoxin
MQNGNMKTSANKHEDVTTLLNTNGDSLLSNKSNLSATPTTFSNMCSNNEYELILYYASWCKYSADFLPEWNEFENYAKDNFPTVNISKMDVDNRILLERNILAYPSIVLYSKTFPPKTFSGSRTVESLANFVKESITN